MDIPITAGVLVAHPGTQHSYELAFALYRARLLERYVTGFYYKEATAWGRAIRISSKAIPPAMRRRLLGRSKMGLPSDRVIVRPFAELLYVGCCRLPWLRRYASRVLEWRNDHFDEFAGTLLFHSLGAIAIGLYLMQTGIVRIDLQPQVPFG